MAIQKNAKAYSKIETHIIVSIIIFGETNEKTYYIDKING